MTQFFRLLRGLRFRLALSYVLFFGVLLTAIGLGFRQNLQSETESQVRAALEESWEGAQAFIGIVAGQPIWREDSQDPNEDFLKERLRLVHIIATPRRDVLSISPTYASIGIDTGDVINRVIETGNPEVSIRATDTGVPYMIRAGRIYGDRGRPYFFAIGRSLDDRRRTVQNFTETYFLALPVMIAVTSLLGWLLAGRALRPVNEVAQAAQTITGSNLNLQIQPRGAGDELDNLISSFNRMTVRLDESFRQIKQFSTDVSHELRTPLTTIRGQLEVALFTAETPEQYRDAMVNALEAVEQLSNIVRALLLLSQAESGQLVLQRDPVELSRMARDIVEQFQIPAEEKYIDLTCRSGAEAVVPGDRVQLERLLSNLLSNAIKYTPEHGTIQVTTDLSGRETVLVVEDTGAGIPAQHLPHIFDRFYRVPGKEAGGTEGLGLGLSFVAWIAKAHGGSVEVDSTKGRGTRFTVRLPSAPVLQEPAREERAAVHGQTGHRQAQTL
jgi:heavy metal sensor kinase